MLRESFCSVCFHFERRSCSTSSTRSQAAFQSRIGSRPSASPRFGEFSAEENVRSAGWSLDFAASV
jgi:hypothetical protein